MSTLTTFMSLTAWTESDDPYSHTQLANNWNLVDLHDHSSGKGKQIPTGGLADHAVTTIKLAEPCVGTTNYIDNSITVEKLSTALLDALSPLGVVQWFWRPSGSTDDIWGDGRASNKLFELCDGRSVVAADHDLSVGGTIVLPDLIGKFLYGGVEGDIGVLGGASSVSLAHTHAVNSHSHTVAAHAHAVAAHSHAISADGAHSHLFVGGRLLHSRRNAPITADGAGDPLQFDDVASNTRTFSLQSVYVAGFNADANGGTYDDDAPMDSSANHAHGAATGDSSPVTTSAAPATDAQAPATNSALGSISILPPHMTLVPVVRVRNP